MQALAIGLFVAAGFAALLVLSLLRARRRAQRAAAAVTSGARLDGVRGALAGHSYPLRRDDTFVGSIAGNDLVVPDPAVSRRHLQVRRTPAGFELIDLGGVNGVWLNGRRVRRALLVPGDRLRLGECDLVFAAGEAGGEGLADRL